MKRIWPLLAALLFAANAYAATTETWVTGKGNASYTPTILCTTADIASLVQGNAVRCTTNQPIANQTNQDIFGEFQATITTGSSTSTGVAENLGVYICPLNADGSTYCDGRFGTSAAGPPDASYYGCTINVPPSVTSIVGTCQATLPPNSFEIILWNNSSQTFGSTPGTIKFFSYDRQQQ